MEPKSCWILCTPRTGSSLLCELLNNLDIFPPFNHPSLTDRRGPLEKGQAFNEWARLYFGPAYFSFYPSPYAKMIFHQYVEAMGSILKPKRYGVGWYHNVHDLEFLKSISLKFNSEYVRRIFPDIHFIHLLRDPLDHAVSLYVARNTKKYHIYSQFDLDRYMDMKIVVESRKLMMAYDDAISYSDSWKWFLKGDEKVLQIQYEEMLLDPGNIIERIGEFLNISFDVEKSLSKTYGSDKRIYRMTHPESLHLKDALSKIISSKMLL